MSKDSSPNHVHFHQARLADVFEDFNKPYDALNSSTNNSSSNAAGGGGGAGTTFHNATTNAGTGGSSASAIRSFLPVEDIYLAPQYQPVNPEDEDDVVPEQHAAFGIARAMDTNRQAAWRDLGLEELMRGVRLGAERDGARRPKMAGRRRAEWGRLGRRVACLR